MGEWEVESNEQRALEAWKKWWQENKAQYDQ